MHESEIARNWIHVFGIYKCQGAIYSRQQKDVDFRQALPGAA